MTWTKAMMCIVFSYNFPVAFRMLDNTGHKHFPFHQWFIALFLDYKF